MGKRHSDCVASGQSTQAIPRNGDVHLTVTSLELILFILQNIFGIKSMCYQHQTMEPRSST